MKKCTKALRFICDNLDSKINSPRCVEIQHHLAECPDCSAYLDSMKKTVTLYRQYPTGTVPPAVHEHLSRTLKKERGKSGEARSRTHR